MASTHSQTSISNRTPTSCVYIVDQSLDMVTHKKRLNIICYENRSKRWSKIVSLKLLDTTETRLPNWGAAAASQSLFRGREMVVIVRHGFDGNFADGYLSVYGIDTVTLEQRELSTLNGTPRPHSQNVSVIGLSDSVIVMYTEGTTTAIERYDPGKNQWFVEKQWTQREFAPVYGHMALAVGDEVYVVGGTRNDEFSRQVLHYNAKKKDFEVVGMLRADKNHFECCAWGDDLLVAAGGYRTEDSAELIHVTGRNRGENILLPTMTSRSRFLMAECDGALIRINRFRDFLPFLPSPSHRPVEELGKTDERSWKASSVQEAFLESHFVGAVTVPLGRVHSRILAFLTS
jgi:hypothetical protein